MMQRSLTVIILLIVIINGEFIEQKSDNTNNVLARRKGYKFPYHGLFYGFSFHTLALLYWIKVKVIIAAFIIGAVVFWGVRYIWYFKTCPETHTHNVPIISYDHGLIQPDHDHHIAYSSHSNDIRELEHYKNKDFEHHLHHNNRKIWKPK